MQATVGPAMVISGLAFLISIMAGRYARCIDRTRELLNMLDHEGEKLTPKKRKAKLYQLKLIYRRCQKLRTMMMLGSLCVFFVVLTITAIFVGLLFQLKLEEITSMLFIVALFFLSVSMGYFMQDIMISLYVIKVEIKEV